MRKMIILISAIILSVSSNAQWSQLNSGITMDLGDIFFKDASNGFCVGGKGVILKTIDGGTHWLKVYQDSVLFMDKVIAKGNNVTAFSRSLTQRFMLQSFDNGSTWNIDTINFRLMEATQSVKYGGTTLFALADNGVIKKYISGQWQSLPGNEVGQIFEVDDHGIYLAKGRYFIKSTDGGNNWTTTQMSSPHMPGGSQYTNANMRVLEDTIILALTYPNTIVFSYDEGITWDDYQNPAIPNNCFISSLQIITGIFGRIIARSIDGGYVFTNQDTFSHVIRSIYFVNENLGFLCGDNGMIYKTTNGGGLPTGIKGTNPLKKKLNIFPNPAKNNIQLQYDNLHIQSLQLTGLSGRIIKTFPPESKILDISGLAAGVYFLKVKAKEGEMTKKVVVTNL